MKTFGPYVFKKLNGPMLLRWPAARGRIEPPVQPSHGRPKMPKIVINDSEAIVDMVEIPIEIEVGRDCHLNIGILIDHRLVFSDPVANSLPPLNPNRFPRRSRGCASADR